jgi:hypothetical protein
MESSTLTRLVHFLQEELGIPAAAIAIAQRLHSRRITEQVHKALTLRYQEQSSSSLLPIILWQHGLVTLEQLDQILDWLDAA